MVYRYTARVGYPINR